MSEIQNVENVSKPEIASKTTFEPSNVEYVNVPEPVLEPIESVQETVTETKSAPENDGDLPEYAKRRIGKVEKKYEREVARLRTELEEARKVSSAPVQQFNQPQNGYIDPITQKYIDISTPEGQAIYSYQQAMSQALTAQERENLARQEKEVEYKLHDHFESSFDDAAAKYPDFATTVKGSGMSLQLGKELAYFPDPGELGYYLASNPQEVNRLQKLPAYEMRRELARHMADMVKKNNITRAPTPVKPLVGGAANPAKHFAHKTLGELKAERRAQLRGQRPR